MKKALLLIAAAFMASASINAQTGFYTLDQINNDTDHALEASEPEVGYWYQSGEETHLTIDSVYCQDAWQLNGEDYWIYEPVFTYYHSFKQTSHTNYVIKKIRVWRETDDHAEKLASREARNTYCYMCYENDDIMDIEWGTGFDGVVQAKLPAAKTYCEAQGIADDGVGDLQTYFGARMGTKENPTKITFRIRLYTVLEDYQNKGTYYVNHGGIYTEDNDAPFRVWEDVIDVYFPNDNVNTAVKEVNAAKDITGVSYYNMQGMQSNQPFDGINIVVTSYSDGTTTSSKVIR